MRPPTLALRTRSGRRGSAVVAAATDAGSGVDPRSLVAPDRRPRAQRPLRRGRVRIATGGLARGRHALVLQVSDYQETRNKENVGHPPEHAVPATTFTVR